MSEYPAITGYRVVIECNPEIGAGGYVDLKTTEDEGESVHSVRNFATYAELAAFVDLLRNEQSLAFGSLRITQGRWQRPGPRMHL